MAKEVNLCSGYNKPKGLTGVLHRAFYKSDYKCTCKAALFENGKWYCKRHAPSKIAEREAKSWQRYTERIRKNVEQNS